MKKEPLNPIVARNESRESFSADSISLPIRHLKSGTPQQRSDRVRVWSISGKRMTLNYVEISSGGKTEVDRHSNEQINYILKGETQLRLGDNPPLELCLRTGDVVVVPSNVSHQFVVAGPDGVSFLGMISPARRS
jgi:quercetin dioxygenase-like cupin family protein